MSWEAVRQFFTESELWQKVVAGVVVLVVGALATFVTRIFRRKLLSPSPDSDVRTVGSDSPAQIATGSAITQRLDIDRSQGKVIIGRVESGATVIINIVDYQDGVVNSENQLVRKLFAEGRSYYEKRKFPEAMNRFERCLELEKNHERRGALNIQIGNCYYEQSRYSQATEFYGAGLREARQAGDAEGMASAKVGIGNTYFGRPASDGLTRAENVRKAVYCYQAALEIRKKDEYPLDYAMIQNNLGTAYRNLPAATAAERARNVRQAMVCYQAALEIDRKEEYPQDYCFTAANLAGC